MGAHWRTTGRMPFVVEWEITMWPTASCQVGSFRTYGGGLVGYFTNHSH